MEKSGRGGVRGEEERELNWVKQKKERNGGKEEKEGRKREDR